MLAEKSIASSLPLKSTLERVRNTGSILYSKLIFELIFPSSNKAKGCAFCKVRTSTTPDILVLMESYVIQFSIANITTSDSRNATRKSLASYSQGRSKFGAFCGIASPPKA
ncbi:hypothetical protein FDENT_11914 [Fusarium denticulatum]|uniref:Uncharacterized protein n=1 Tax=Fusarium denticulatum TaxID=48507 RepID=A0A8H5WS46_9HYPO|nr:hypothetical protein FDENT_11914 [Fusarium denticulatum]